MEVTNYLLTGMILQVGGVRKLSAYFQGQNLCFRNQQTKDFFEGSKNHQKIRNKKMLIPTG